MSDRCVNNHIHQRGAAVVEFAILLLLLLVLLFGLIDFGFLWLQSHYVSNAAREGARIASKIPSSNFGTSNSDDKIEKAVTDYLHGFYDFDSKDVSCCSDETSDALFRIVAKKGAVIDDEFVPDSEEEDAPQAAQIEVTVQSEQIHEPILWDLLSLIGGQDTEVKEISEKAVFVFENE